MLQQIFSTLVRPGLRPALALVLGLSSLGLHGIAEAAPRAAKAAAPASAAASAVDMALRPSKTFAELGAGADPLRLSTAHDVFMLKLPLAPRERLSAAVLHLDAVNSTALIRSRSALTIRVNGRVLDQITLDPEKTRNVRDLPIPTDWLKVGYNEVTFEAVQHYTYDCEDPSSPELWTDINTQQSRVSLQFDGLKPNLGPRLSQLDLAYDARAWIAHPVAFIAGTEHLSEAQLAAAAVVAQGIGLRMAPGLPRFQVYGANAALAQAGTGDPNLPGLAPDVVRGRDVVLIGRRAELSRYMGGDLYKQTEAGPFVGIFPMMQGDTVALVVTGETDEDVMAAARAVAERNYRFGEAVSETVKTRFAFTAPPEAQPGHAVAFDHFDYRTSSTRGSKLQQIYLKFKAPSDYAARKGDLATLRLHFSYGAGMRRDSSLVLRLNGQFAVALPLNEETGAEYLKYELKLPAQYVRPGYNDLSFEPVMIGHKDRCDAQRDEGLLATVYQDSTIELPRPTTAPVAPDLARFGNGLWPYDRGGLRLYVAQADMGTARATLALASAMAQHNKGLMDVQLKYAPFETGHMMVVGNPRNLADFVVKALPLPQYDWAEQGRQSAFLQGTEGQRVITAFLSSHPENLQDALLALQANGLWRGMEGQASFIDASEPSITNEPATHTESFGLVNEYALLFEDWKVMAFWVLALAALFAIAFIGAVRRLARRRADVRSRVPPGDDELPPFDGGNNER